MSINKFNTWTLVYSTNWLIQLFSTSLLIELMGTVNMARQQMSLSYLLVGVIRKLCISRIFWFDLFPCVTIVLLVLLQFKLSKFLIISILWLSPFIVPIVLRQSAHKASASSLCFCESDMNIVHWISEETNSLSWSQFSLDACGIHSINLMELRGLNGQTSFQQKFYFKTTLRCVS